MAASMQSTGAFSVTMPLMKVWQDDAGEMWFEGVASSTRLDKQQERMTPNAIKKMGEQTGIDLLPSHSAGALEELGVVEDTWVDNDQFRIAGRLDGNSPEARRLFEKVAAGRPYALSVGGHVRQAYWEFDDDAGKPVRHIDDVALDHVAVCRPDAAANPDTYLSVIAKAADSIAGEPPMGAFPGGGEAEDDLLIRIGRAAAQAARSMWPFGKSDESDGGGEDEEAVEMAKAAEDLTALHEEIIDTLAMVRKALADLQDVSKAEEEARLEAGRSQTIPGQETYAPAAESEWSCVL